MANPGETITGLPVSGADASQMEIEVALRGMIASALQEMKDKCQRAEATAQSLAEKLQAAEMEMVNLRARMRREVEEARLFGVQKFARDVVEAAENLKRGIDSLPRPTADEPEMLTKLRHGFQGIERAFITLLERNGIDRQDPTGTQFDPHFHQAMAEQEAADYPAGTVLHAWSQSWTLNGRLLRPGMVVVAKGGPALALRVDVGPP